MLSRTVVALLLALALPSAARAEWPPKIGTGGGGTSPFNFLKFDVGARAVGMGGAAVAAAEDATALFWNPALLSILPDHELSASHTQWFQTMKHDAVVYAQRVGQSSGLAIGATNLSMAPIPRSLETDASAPVPGSYGGEPETYNVTAMMIQIGWSTHLGDWTSSTLAGLTDGAIGVAAKMAMQTLDGEVQRVFAADVGYLYAASETGWRAAFAIQNLGPALKSREVPQMLRVGAWDTFWKERIGLAYDLAFGSDAILRSHVGLELAEKIAGQKIALRAGYKIEQDVASTSGVSAKNFDRAQGISVGMGLHFNIRLSKNGHFAARLDYAYQPYGVLGPTQRMGLLIGF